MYGSFCRRRAVFMYCLVFLHPAPRPCRCFFGLGGAKTGPPANYEAITSQAIAAVQAGLRKGEKAMEVEVSNIVQQPAVISYKYCHQIVSFVSRAFGSIPPSPPEANLPNAVCFHPGRKVVWHTYRRTHQFAIHWHHRSSWQKMSLSAFLEEPTARTTKNALLAVCDGDPLCFYLVSFFRSFLLWPP